MSRAKRKPAARAAADVPAVPVSTPAWRHPLWWLLPPVALLYLALAWLTSGQQTLWALAVVDGQQLFAIDDAYRYFLAQTAWQDAALYSWNYFLPAALLADGTLATLTGGNLFLMRALHIVPALLTLWFTWQAGVRLGAARWQMSVSVLLLALMPLYAFVFLSFYGENWLALGVAAGVYCFVSGRERAAALLFALLPLLRPEGIFFLAPLALYWLLQRRWLLLVLLGGPGFLYALYLLFALDHLGQFGNWRLQLLRILDSVQSVPLRRTWGFVDSFNLLWIVPALLAFATAPLRRIWPLWAGGVAWLAWTVASVARDLSYYEARYLLSLLPLLAIAWPFAFRWLATRLHFPRAAPAVTALFLVLATFVAAEHLLQLDPFKAAFGDRRWPVAGMPATRDNVGTLSARGNAVRADIARGVEAMVVGNPAITRVLVHSTEIFYHLDANLVQRVQVEYVPASDSIVAALGEGAQFAMYPGGEQYGWYRLRAPRAGDRELAVYVGRLQHADFPPMHRVGIFAVYLVAVDATLAGGLPHPDHAASSPR